MSNYVTLLGAEEVSRASSGMQTAAANMSSAASYFDDVMLRHQRFMDDWLIRFEEVLTKLETKSRKHSSFGCCMSARQPARLMRVQSASL